MIPKNTFSGCGTWTLDDLKFGLGSRGISERPSSRFAIEYDGYTLVDAFVAYRMSAALDLQLAAAGRSDVVRSLVAILTQEHEHALEWIDSGSPRRAP